MKKSAKSATAVAVRPGASTAIPGTAVAYYRTSSATNVGADKDTLPRQQDAVRGYARAHGLEVVREFYDASVCGADPVDSRKGFAEMMSYMLGNGARTIIVESAGRFARDLIVQETGYHSLKARGVELIAADSPESFTSDTPTAVLIRQILGAVQQFDKATLVNKLRGARDRKSAKLGRRIEGNPAWKAVPDAVVEAARAAHSRGLSLRGISADLAAKGMLAPSGKPYGAQSVKVMVQPSQPNTLDGHFVMSKRVPANLRHTIDARSQGRPTFTVTLTAYPDDKLDNVVTIVKKSHSNRSLPEAQEIMTSLPCAVVSGLPFENKATRIVEAFAAIGATAQLAEDDPKWDPTSKPFGPGY